MVEPLLASPTVVGPGLDDPNVNARASPAFIESGTNSAGMPLLGNDDYGLFVGFQHGQDIVGIEVGARHHTGTLGSKFESHDVRGMSAVRCLSIPRASVTPVTCGLK